VFLNGQLVDGHIFGRWSPGELHAQDACYIGFESHQGQPAHQELQFEGAIDELLIFSRVLTLSEIDVHARPHPLMVALRFLNHLKSARERLDRGRQRGRW
jgi:hypothetical protein